MNFKLYYKYIVINLKKKTMIPNGTGETGYLHGEERNHCDGNIGCLHVEE